jgi:hypothetical protein
VSRCKGVPAVSCACSDDEVSCACSNGNDTALGIGQQPADRLAVGRRSGPIATHHDRLLPHRKSVNLPGRKVELWARATRVMPSARLMMSSPRGGPRFERAGVRRRDSMVAQYIDSKIRAGGAS